MRTSRDGQFAAFRAAHRRRLLGVATLLTGDPEAAERRAHAVLARLYANWPNTSQPVRAAYAGVLAGDHLGQPLPWARPRRFELLDINPDRTNPGLPMTAGDLTADLAGLPPADRAAVVLLHYARLPLADVAGVLGISPAQAREAAERGQRVLAARVPRRGQTAALAGELSAATATASAAEAEPDDRAAGRRLLSRRRSRDLAVAVVALLALIAGLRLVAPAEVTQRVAAAPASTSAPTSAPVPYNCDPQTPACRAVILSSWRSAMALVVSSHLDPKGTYFTGYSYSYTDTYEGDGFWSGAGGALALDLFRIEDGATEVSLQIATSRRFALRCGQLTGQLCFSHRFMDGNRFVLTETTTAEEGVEVQQAPTGTYVITVAARRTAREGRTLTVTSADLMRLVDDDRLRLPVL